MILSTDRTPFGPRALLESVGAIFAVFDARTQDSGNVSFGVEVEGQRYFVKTAGDRSVAGALLNHAGRVAVLENAITFARSVRHPSLPRLLNVIASATGPMLIYEWVDGELVHAPSKTRADPRSAFQRFRALAVPELVAAVRLIMDAHAAFARGGWIACDFYDGSIIYDFDLSAVHLVDLDHYHKGPFTNEMGRMLGSTRFMAPEEFVRGELVDETTTVFTLSRLLAVFLGDGTLSRAAFRGSDALYALMCKGCEQERGRRFQSVDALARAWVEAL